MKIREHRDEKDRIFRIEYVLSNESRQEITHGFSYKYARDMYKSMGDVMGLDQKKMYLSRRK